MTPTISLGIESNLESGNIKSDSTKFSVINYVGKMHRPESHTRSLKSRKPYTRSKRNEDDSTSSSIESSPRSIIVDSYVDYSDDSMSMKCSGDQEDDNIDETNQNQIEQRIRTSSVSSSGCSSSMDDRNSDFYPDCCSCTSYSMSEYDDDGFRDDEKSQSSSYSVLLHSNNHKQYSNPNKGLFEIAIKTVKLIRKNQELQERLSQLQSETNDFIASVMANPENQQFRKQIQPSAEK